MGIARTLVLCATVVWAMATDRAAAADARWQPQVEQVLRSALAERWPQVQEWSMRPLLTKRQRTKLDALTIRQVAVAQTGARSTVRVISGTSSHEMTTTVWFAVEGREPVLSATSALSAGTVLSPQHVSVRMQDVLARDCTLSGGMGALIAMRLKRAVQAGEMLCSADVEPAPLVARGEAVTVRAIAGAVTLTTRGIAERDGMLGSVLPVRNLASGATFEAAVTGRAEVTVQ
jgi:flagella basal body P-ring formation protein FlgA